MAINDHSVEHWLASRACTVAVLFALLGFGCSAPPPDESGYGENLLMSRAAKDKYLLTDIESPVLANRRDEFLPLSYYQPDPSYRVPAQLVLAEQPVVVQMPTSTGELERWRRVGRLEFWLDGDPRSLSAFASTTEASLFVPFRDETSGDETYGAGRYLDLGLTATGIYDLDFNRAYHPFCYFNDRWVCPLPPPENRLSTAVKAGERLPSMSVGDPEWNERGTLLRCRRC